ncbi:hypothetical protein CRG98_010490 [Punica granatum]|uniref:Uncharacterized protein n=1 Tax=Punica granatum TaxID=22663 RepID=A0A2I0KKW8_PUNGR|nr:hypothetical protein CRG98_010490 [Punica granatum]
MKRKNLKRSGGGSGKTGGRKKTKGPLSRSLQPGQQAQLFSLRPQPPPPSFPPFQSLQDSDSAPLEPHRHTMPAHDFDAPDANLDFILSQDFFCTPDYITPDNQNLLNSVNFNKSKFLICAGEHSLPEVTGESKNCEQNKWTRN